MTLASVTKLGPEETGLRLQRPTPSVQLDLRIG